MFDPRPYERRANLDWLQIGAVAALMLIGVAFVFSATMANESLRELPWYKQRYFVQIVGCLVGVAAAGGICLVDYRSLARWSLVAYWGSILLLVAVFVFGSAKFGAKRWIDFGPVQLQPSEFAKLAFIFAMANFLSRPADELRRRDVFWKGIGMTVLPFGLILKEPDLGSALVILPVGLAMMYVAGVPVRYMMQLGIGGGLLVALILVEVLFAPPQLQKIKLEDYQKRRLQVYFGLDFASKDASAAERQRLRKEQRDHSYNVEQALISVGSGGVLGKGFREGSQIALGYLPRAVAHNDFIFSVIAEEKGFMGSVVVITLYSVVMFTGLRTAGQARDRLGKLLAVGVVALLFSHVFINIGMNIRIMPVTGVPLPLLSYGGTSVLCSLIAAGILQNVHLYRRAY